MKSQRTFAELRCRMIRQNLTQKELAQTAGIADATMTDRMAGRSYFRVNEIIRIAKRLEIPAADYYRFFFDGENYPTKHFRRITEGRDYHEPKKINCTLGGKP